MAKKKWFFQRSDSKKNASSLLDMLGKDGVKISGEQIFGGWKEMGRNPEEETDSIKTPPKA